VDLVAVDAPIREATTAAVRNGHTRIPVYEERVDHIVGVVHAQDLLFGAADDSPARSVLRPVKYVPDQKRVDELLHEMRREREHFAVVVDEYGGSVGIVTIEDLLEEIIGDIRDERDQEGPGLRRIADNEWRVPARVHIDELERAIGRTLPPGDYETIAGMILSETGRIPRTGEIVKVGDLRFRIDESNERAIQTVHVTVPPKEGVVRRKTV
jgi:CBS domain containing-hemolysin-like protein